MAYSIQRAVSDGTLSTITLDIDFFEKEHITVLVADRVLPNDTYTYTWVTNNTISITPNVPAGIEVVLKRSTPYAEPFHNFRLGAVFKDETMDENFKQVLFLTQEAIEGQISTDFYTNLNFHGYRLRNVGPAIAAFDAVPLSQYQGDANGAYQSRVAAEASRVAAAAAQNAASASAGAARVSATTAAGSATAAAGSASAAASSASAASTSETNAANSATSAQLSADTAHSFVAQYESLLDNMPIHASQVGYDNGTVQDVMDSAKPMVDYTALRAYTGRATSVRITSDGIAGFFYLDASDTTSTDNGGTIIVDAIGRRWFREFSSAVNVRWFGAKGDWDSNTNTGTDDTAAIQAAINYISPTTYNATAGGGEVFFSPGKYRITSGIVVGWGTRLVGTGSGGFPYNGANTKHSMIVADFGSNVNQWIIDSATYDKQSGTHVEYNAFVNANIDEEFNSCHQIGIEGLHIVCADVTTNIIYGGVRLVGCPDSKIRDVTVVGSGIAFQLNTSFASEISNCHSETHYYGVIIYESCNSCRIDGYFNKIINPSSLPVPADRIPSWMPSAAAMTSALELDSSHATSAKGLIIAAPSGSSSQMAEVSVTLEYWPDTVFLFNSYSTLFKTLYTESTYVNYILTGAYCSAVIEEHSVYATNAKGFDIGYSGICDARIQGLYVVNSLINNISDNIATTNNANLKLRGISSKGNTQHPRLSYEAEAKPVTYLSFAGADLSIKNSYNITGISRVSGEPVGDYWIDFKRPSNATAINGEPIVSVTLAGYGFASVWIGGGDGIQNERVRIRCMDFTGRPFNPGRVMVVIYG